MNSNLDLYKITEAIVTLMEQFGIVIEDANVDLVPYLKTLGEKIVTYKESIAWLWIGVAAAIAIVAIILTIILFINNEYGSAAVVIMAGLFIACCIGLYNAHTVIECKTFPEKVILEYIDEVTTTSTNNGRR